MRCHTLALLFALCFCTGVRSSVAQEGPAHCVMDATTGYVFDANRANVKAQVGSLTKTATAIVVLDWAKKTRTELNQLVTVTPSAAAIQGINPVGFQAGDSATLRDLLFAVLLQSDNIAAQTLAEHVGQTLGGSNPPAVQFVAQMNALARSLGMKNTLFLNPHGLDEGERKLPHSTAHDMALLARHAMGRPEFTFFVSQKERKISVVRASGEQSGYQLQNTNELLGRNDIDGVKTGKTRRAGECVVISAAKAPESRQEGEKVFITPRRLIVVVLGASDRFGAAAGLLERGWQQHTAWAAEGRPLPSKR